MTSNPVVQKLRNLLGRVRQASFSNSGSYWESRYKSGGTSGPGSYGKYAQFKAQVINNFIAKQGIQSVIEFGCGDGNQLKYLNYPSYIGLDVSKTAVSTCKKTFQQDSTKQFFLMDEYVGQTADLALSLDVIYHLVEDSTFESYMQALFSASNRFVVIYSSNFSQLPSRQEPHIRHHEFTEWIQKNMPRWKQTDYIANTEGSWANFFFFQLDLRHVCSD